MKVKVAIASDHGGLNIKKMLVEKLTELGYEMKDFGPITNESVDYPDYAFPLCEAVASGEYDKGILICGTGIGMSISANKVKGIRAALVHDIFSAKATREHNDSNVLCMGERVIGPALAEEIAKVWLGTDFEGGRHNNRVDKIKNYEK